MSGSFRHLRAAITSMPWAIMPQRLEAIVEVVTRRVEGYRLSADEIEAIKGERQPNGVVALYRVPDAPDAPDAYMLPSARANSPSSPVATNIAVINVRGIVAQHASAVDDISGGGGTSTERIGMALDEAASNPTVKAIVLNFDSPGGSVYNVQELADRITAMSATIPIVAQVNSLAASAAYWLASVCSEVVVTPSGEVGGIGVYCVHEDMSAAADAAGLHYTFISAGKYKVEANQFSPLSEPAHAAMQASVNRYYGMFTGAVARGRGVSVDTVRDGFGEGRVVGAQEAVKLGMADRVATLDQTLRRLGASGKAGAKRVTSALGEEDAVKAGMTTHEAYAQYQATIRAAVDISDASRLIQSEHVAEFKKVIADLQAIINARVVLPSEQQSASEAIADTSPRMKICADCGCNMEALQGVDGKMAAAGLGTDDMPSDVLPTQEHPASSKMEKCPTCGRMREPPAANGKDATTEPSKVDTAAWRRRRHAHRGRSIF